MNQSVPFKDNYDLVKLLSKFSNIVLYISTFILIIAFIIINFASQYSSFSKFLIKANCILVIIYIALSIILDYLLFIARKKKRLDLIDNAFGTSMTTEQSYGYFTNEHVKPGIYKLAVNSFENTHFSLNIGKAMLLKTILLNTFILLLFLISAIYGLNNLVVFIIQLSLATIMLKGIVKLILYVSFLENVYLKYCSLFDDLKDLESNKIIKIPAMISNILEYESILSWANILLSEGKYNELNVKLSLKWEEIKKKYKIIS